MPTSSASVPALRFSTFLLFQLIDFVAYSFHMVKAIEERLAVDAHPREKGLDFLILVEDEPCVDDGLLQEETDRLVVGDAIAERVNLVKFVEDVRVVVLHLRRGAGFVGEDAEQGAARNAVLHGREHVFPDAELKAGHSTPMPGVSFSSMALRRATSKQLMMVNVSCDSCRLYR